MRATISSIKRTEKKRLNTKETNSVAKNGTWNQRRVSKSRSKMNTKYFYKD